MKGQNLKEVRSLGDYARKSINLQIALLKEVNPRVQLPKVRNLKIVHENNLPRITHAEIVRLNEVKEQSQLQSSQFAPTPLKSGRASGE